MKCHFFPPLFTLLLVGLSGCTGKSDGPVALQTNVPDAASATETKKETANNPKEIVGKKVFRLAQGPEDTVQFEITLLENGKVGGNPDGSISGATGILYYEHGAWEAVGPDIIVTIYFLGQISQPAGDGFKQVETSQKLNFRIPALELARAKNGSFEYLSEFTSD
jgi:hypothetical protein